MNTRVFAAASMLLLCLVPAYAHHCGDTPVTVEVGKRVVYRITADVQESQASHYNVSINSDPSVATVAPDNFNSFGYGEFVIEGVKAGTNTLVLEWSYAPNQAFDFCVVPVIVIGPPTDPRDAADQTTASEAEN